MFERIKGLLTRNTSGLSSPSDWFKSLFTTATTSSSVVVTPETALNYSTVYACVSLIAETVASLPLNVYKAEGDRKEKATNHPLQTLLHDSPSPEHTSFAWREFVMTSLLLWGNSFNVIIRNKGGQVLQIIPLMPEYIHIERRGGVYRYYYSGQLLEYEVFHILGMSRNGVTGLSPVDLLKESIGLSLAAEEYGARFFGSGTAPAGVLETDETLSPEAIKNLKTSIGTAYSGLGKSHGLMLLEYGLKYKAVTIPPDTSQFLETRSFQRSEICGAYRVPCHMVGDIEKQTSWGSGVEQQQIGFVVNTIRPWLVRCEQQLNATLLTTAERKAGYYIKFVVDGLMRGDMKSRYESYQIGRTNGWLSANDIRALEDMNPIDGGDQYITPLNMAPSNMLEEINKPESKALPFTSETRSGETTLNPVIEAHKPELLQAFSRMIDMEVKDVSAALDKHLGERSTSTFLAWLEDYYSGYGERMKKADGVVPNLRKFANAVIKQAHFRLEIDPKQSEELNTFVTEYIDTFLERRRGRAYNGLVKEILDENALNISVRVKALLAEWSEKAPIKITNEESVRQAHAVARQAWISSGITKFQWRASGGNNCPFCSQLDGKIVGRNEVFLKRDDVLSAQDEKGNWSSLKASSNFNHPPIHRGCDCTIVPVKG